jgi:hypothetical protein
MVPAPRHAGPVQARLLPAPWPGSVPRRPWTSTSMSSRSWAHRQPRWLRPSGLRTTRLGLRRRSRWRSGPCCRHRECPGRRRQRLRRDCGHGHRAGDGGARLRDRHPPNSLRTQEKKPDPAGAGRRCAPGPVRCHGGRAGAATGAGAGAGGAGWSGSTPLITGSCLALAFSRRGDADLVVRLLDHRVAGLQAPGAGRRGAGARACSSASPGACWAPAARSRAA